MKRPDTQHTHNSAGDSYLMIKSWPQRWPCSSIVPPFYIEACVWHIVLHTHIKFDGFVGRPRKNKVVFHCISPAQQEIFMFLWIFVCVLIYITF